MSEEFIPTLTHATERDIDLLLVEELHVTLAFVAWMAQRAGLPDDISTATVLHSKRRTRNRREIDIFVEAISQSGQTLALLIENKLDASEQPDQAESYREELEALADRFATGATILVCPLAYRQQHSEFAAKFDCVIPYEDLADWFRERADQGQDSVRMRFRASIIDQAITKARRGYTPVPNEVIGGFNARYVELLEALAPGIFPGPSMLREANPDESVSMIFDARRSLAFLPDELRPSRFAHEFGRGQDTRANYVAVVFPGWGRALPMIRERLERDTAGLNVTFATKPATKARPRPGLVMAWPSPAVDNKGDFEAQRGLMEQGIMVALEVQAWLRTNQPVLHQWKSMVDAVIEKL